MPEIVTQKVRMNGIPMDIFKELLLWGDASWWPSGCAMKIFNHSGTNDVGAVYHYSVDIPLGPKWKAANRIVDKKNMYLRRDFFDGDFDGFEEASITTDENGYCEIIFTFAAEVKGTINKFFWNRFGKDLHRRNIELIFRALKSYIERRR